ncbi:MAG: class 1 fructose-bisphosphatase [Alphaproteobacteria bacterium]|nr:class 1 fructose-bisphosphatase [Alphaproteobacteria bacterium]
MSLQGFLSASAAAGHADDDQVSIIASLAEAAKSIDHLVRRNSIVADLGTETGGANADGDHQKALDVKAEGLILEHLSATNAAALLSEEQDDAVLLDPDGSVIVAVDPLDGSSNISVNVTIGTIFSLLPSHGDAAANTLQAGRHQLAAGFFTYGPQTTLVLTFAGGGDVAGFILCPDSGEFIRSGGALSVPADTKEFAVNSAYTNYWFPPMKQWMDDTLMGKSGPCEKDYRMRWIASLVADGWRILQRGGIFLYPADQRPGNETGRLRLVYEANPIGLLMERAGGMAIDGVNPILDLVPENLHQRVPLFFGATSEVKRLQHHHSSAD